MASTYSDRLRLELMATGEKNATWGATANTGVFELLEDSIAGVVGITMTDANYTLSTNNGSTDEARQMIIVASGTNTATRDIIAPSEEKLYVIKNSTTGGFSVRILVTGNTAVTVPNGSTVIVYCDGTNFYSVTGSIASQAASSVAITGGTITGITDLAVADGGTGASTAAGAATALGLGTGDSPQFTAVNIGAATDTTVTRVSAGVIAVEGNTIYHAGGTDVPVTDGGTGASTAAGAATNLGLGTGDSPQFTAVNIGAATDTTVTRVSAGVIAVEGNTIYHAGGTDVPVTDGGTGASTATGAASNLGLGTEDSPTFAGLTIEDTVPILVLTDSDSATNEKIWRLRNTAGVLSVQAVSDAGTASSAITFSRTSITTTEIQFDATALDINGDVDISGALTLGTELAVAEGGTGGTTAATARTNLDVAQIPSSSTLPVGTLAVLIYNGSSTITDGSTTAGTGLTLAYGHTGSDGLQFGGAVQTGTWKNITGVSITTADRVGTWVRTA